MIDTLKHITVQKDNGLFRVGDKDFLTNSDEKELHFWKNDILEAPDGDLFDNVVNKAYLIRIFNQVLPYLELTGHEKILELGGGHSWASALIKREYPDCYVVASDLSADAVKFVKKYEDLLGVQINEKWAFNCRQIPFEDNQFDRIFTLVAFHHFGEKNDFSKVLKEMVRILKPGGQAKLLCEPTSPKYLYKWAHKRVNKKRQFVDEDVLVLSKIKQTCREIACDLTHAYYPFYENRIGVMETVYYFVLSYLRFLQPLLPCTINLTIKKRKKG